MQKLVKVTADELRAIVQAHKEWLQSDHKRGKRADLRQANLRLQRLIGVDLSAALFDGANLIGAELKGATLTRASLRGTNITDGNLEGCSLAGADLSRATLRNATLVGACLFKANLTMADLRGANLEGAQLNDTILAASNLGNCKGLERCEHVGPSALDLRTLERSGDLPESFLVGCGVASQIAVALPGLLADTREWPPCLIYHAGEDAGSARKLCESLRQEGLRAWAVLADLEEGSTARPVTDPGSGAAIIVLISHESKEREWIERVSSWARRLEKERGEDLLFFVDLTGARYAAERELQEAKDHGLTVDEPSFLRRQRSEVWWDPEGAPEGLWDLVEHLRTAVRRREQPAAGRLPFDPPSEIDPDE